MKQLFVLDFSFQLMFLISGRGRELKLRILAPLLHPGRSEATSPAQLLKENLILT